MRTPFNKFICLITVLGLFAGGCQKEPPLKNPTSAEIRLNLRHEPATLDPRKGGDIISSHMHFLLFEGLVRLNSDQSLTLAQAESFTTSSDKLTYTFKLRPSKWSNGEPVTAYDFELAWKKVLDPNFPGPNAHLFYPIKNAKQAKQGLCSAAEVGVNALNPFTLQIRLEKPTPYLLELLSFCAFFPVCSTIDDKDPTWAQDAGNHFVSNGPFTLQEWKHHHELIAIKNPLYWDHKATRPDKIHFSMIGDEMTALQLFEQGSLDMLGDPLCPLPSEAITSLKKEGALRQHCIGATTFITFNTEKFPFNHPKVRRAFALAINRQALVTNVLQTGEIPALTMIPPALVKESLPLYADNSQQEARQLLQEGLKELGTTKEQLPKLTFFYSQSDRHHKLVQALQQQWKETLGIEISLETMDFKILMDKLYKKDYLFAQSMWAAQYNDPMNIFERFYEKSQAKNYPAWENSTYQKLIDKSFYASAEEREKLLFQAEAIFAQEMPVAPIYHWNLTYIAQPYLEDVDISPIGDLLFNLLSLKRPRESSN